MIRVYEFLAVGGIAILSFIGIQLAHLGKKNAMWVSIGVSLVLIFFNEKLQDETGKGIVGHIYCSLFKCVGQHAATAIAPAPAPDPEPSDSGIPIAEPDPVEMVEGVFGSAWGPVHFGPNGGSWSHGQGVLSIAARDGNVVTGHWQRPPGLFDKPCPNGRFEGDFRFTFDPGGFTGLWSQCQGPLSGVWNGWRPKPVRFRNHCPYPVDIFLEWTDQTDAPRANGPWTVAPAGELDLRTSTENRSELIRAASTSMKAYVRAHDSLASVFSGTNQIIVGENIYAAKPVAAVEEDALLVVAAGCEPPSAASGNTTTAM